MNVEGVLPVFKPEGLTSHGVVEKARKQLGIRRIGHTGTLDPQVRGVLVLCLGRATRIVEYLQELPKEYEAEITFGIATDTQDLTGRIVDTTEKVSLSEDRVQNVLKGFVGKIEQVPPMYSAVRIGGQRLYELARSGVTVERKPRLVDIYDIDILKMDLKSARPKISLKILCGKGTYIRTLCADIGKALGYPAVMSDLVRTASGSIRIADCLSLEQLDKGAHEGWIARRIIPIDQALDHLDSSFVEVQDVQKALHGQPVPFSRLHPKPRPGAGRIRLYSENRRFLGIFVPDSKGELVLPEKIFPPQSFSSSMN